MRTAAAVDQCSTYLSLAGLPDRATMLRMRGLPMLANSSLERSVCDVGRRELPRRRSAAAGKHGDHGLVMPPSHSSVSLSSAVRGHGS